MAQKRMFSLTVVDTDKFLDMPPTARLLYYELGMRADDDGFIASPKRIARLCGASEQDLQTLCDEGYLIRFESGVVVITHWKVNNLIKSDRYHPTGWIDEREQLSLQNNIYIVQKQSNMVPEAEPQVRLGKVRLGKDRLGEERAEKERTGEERTAEERAAEDSENFAAAVILSFHEICRELPRVELTESRCELIRNALPALNGMGYADYFRRVQRSDFLTGRTGKWTGCTFDWLLRPDTIQKLRDGVYDNRPSVRRTSYDIEELERIDTLDFV